MAKLKESVESMHAQTLREQGFIRIVTGHDGDWLKDPATLLRNTGIEIGIPPPWRVMTDSAIFVIDETGLLWAGPLEADMSHLDFKDISEEFKKGRSILNQSNPRLN